MMNRMQLTLPNPPDDQHVPPPNKTFPEQLAISLFLFLLFWEWLRPLTAMAELTDIHRINPFIWAIGTYLFIDAVRMPGWIGWTLKAVFTVGWIGYWFAPDALASGAWWLQVATIVADDYERTVNGDWLSISPELRTFVFLLGWAALVYAVFRIVTERGQALWFVGATVSFLLLLQLWPGIDTNAGLIRSAIWGLSMLALLNVRRWEQASGFVQIGGRRPILSGALAGVLVGSIALGLGYAFSSAQPKQIEPVHLMDDVLAWAAGGSKTAGTSFSPAAKTGYGSYDGNLGASVAPDDSVAFIAHSTVPAYWRGDSKDIYTGRGWRKSALSDNAEVFRSGTADASAPAGTGAAQAELSVASPTISQEVRIVDEGLSRMVFAGGEVLRFRELSARDGSSLSDIHIRHDAETGSYFVGTGDVELSSYAIEASVGIRNPETLLLAEGNATVEAIPDEITRRNLQLPERLPDRVSELAKRIVRDVPDNRLLEVLAVQRYLQENYKYTLKSQLPPQGADFADYFLFEQREGYCNHFSTAMVVLLRSLGIESRWVKGFAPGTADSRESGMYVIRNSDAHSWVEVYFPGAGWVPFEATPGFGGVSSGGDSLSPDAILAAGGAAEGSTLAVNMVLPEGGLLRDLRFARADAILPEASATSVEPQPATLVGRILKQLTAGALSMRNSAVEGLGELEAWYEAASAAERRLPGALAGLAAVLTVAVIALIAAAVRRAPKKLRPAWRSRASAEALERLDSFWGKLYRRYGKRPASCTLREYVQLRLPAESRGALEELLQYDETVRFGGDPGRRATRQWLDDVWRRVTG
jgi:hypothetical protein